MAGTAGGLHNPNEHKALVLSDLADSFTDVREIVRMAAACHSLAPQGRALQLLKEDKTRARVFSYLASFLNAQGIARTATARHCLALGRLAEQLNKEKLLTHLGWMLAAALEVTEFDPDEEFDPDVSAVQMALAEEIREHAETILSSQGSIISAFAEMNITYYRLELEDNPEPTPAPHGLRTPSSLGEFFWMSNQLRGVVDSLRGGALAFQGPDQMRIFALPRGCVEAARRVRRSHCTVAVLAAHYADSENSESAAEDAESESTQLWSAHSGEHDGDADHVPQPRWIQNRVKVWPTPTSSGWLGGSRSSAPQSHADSDTLIGQLPQDHAERDEPVLEPMRAEGEDGRIVHLQLCLPNLWIYVRDEQGREVDVRFQGLHSLNIEEGLGALDPDLAAKLEQFCKFWYPKALPKVLESFAVGSGGGKGRREKGRKRRREKAASVTLADQILGKAAQVVDKVTALEGLFKEHVKAAVDLCVKHGLTQASLCQRAWSCSLTTPDWHKESFRGVEFLDLEVNCCIIADYWNLPMADYLLRPPTLFCTSSSPFDSRSSACVEDFQKAMRRIEWLNACHAGGRLQFGLVATEQSAASLLCCIRIVGVADAQRPHVLPAMLGSASFTEQGPDLFTSAQRRLGELKAFYNLIAEVAQHVCPLAIKIFKEQLELAASSSSSSVQGIETNVILLGLHLGVCFKESRKKLLGVIDKNVSRPRALWSVQRDLLKAEGWAKRELFEEDILSHLGCYRIDHASMMWECEKCADDSEFVDWDGLTSEAWNKNHVGRLNVEALVTLTTRILHLGKPLLMSSEFKNSMQCVVRAHRFGLEEQFALVFLDAHMWLQPVWAWQAAPCFEGNWPSSIQTRLNKLSDFCYHLDKITGDLKPAAIKTFKKQLAALFRPDLANQMPQVLQDIETNCLLLLIHLGVCVKKSLEKFIVITTDRSPLRRERNVLVSLQTALLKAGEWWPHDLFEEEILSHLNCYSIDHSIIMGDCKELSELDKLTAFWSAADWFCLGLQDLYDPGLDMGKRSDFHLEALMTWTTNYLHHRKPLLMSNQLSEFQESVQRVVTAHRSGREEQFALVLLDAHVWLTEAHGQSPTCSTWTTTLSPSAQFRYRLMELSDFYSVLRWPSWHEVRNSTRYNFDWQAPPGLCTTTFSHQLILAERSRSKEVLEDLKTNCILLTLYSGVHVKETLKKLLDVMAFEGGFAQDVHASVQAALRRAEGWEPRGLFEEEFLSTLDLGCHSVNHTHLEDFCKRLVSEGVQQRAVYGESDLAAVAHSLRLASLACNCGPDRLNIDVEALATRMSKHLHPLLMSDQLTRFQDSVRRVVTAHREGHQQFAMVWLDTVKVDLPDKIWEAFHQHPEGSTWMYPSSTMDWLQDSLREPLLPS